MKIVNVSTHSRAKAAGVWSGVLHTWLSSFNSQPREGGWTMLPPDTFDPSVSTHSRAKAAGTCGQRCASTAHGFNSQPREGGWG